MLDKAFDTYHRIEAEKKDLLPSCMEYNFFLDKAVEKLKITIDEVRTKYGCYTHGQWKELLQLF